MRGMRLGVRRNLALALVLGTGCATAASETKSALERLQESVEGYNHAFRWKNYERAAMFLPNEKRSAYLAAYEDDEASLQVEEFAVRNVDMDGTKGAKVQIKVTYLMLPSVMVEKKTLTQHWKEVNGEWVLEHEDNSIRSLDPNKQPRDPRARAGAGGGAGKSIGNDPSAGNTEVEVESEWSQEPGGDPNANEPEPR